MTKKHRYQTVTTWTGNLGKGTADYKGYERSHTVSITGKPDLRCTSDPAFRGDPTKHNPEELLVAALSGCHMLWFLHLCAVNGVIVSEYSDKAVGIMEENNDGSGQFTEVILYPEVTVTDERMLEKAERLHDEAHRMCFIARSVTFPVLHKPSTRVLHSTSSAS